MANLTFTYLNNRTRRALGLTSDDHHSILPPDHMLMLANAAAEHTRFDLCDKVEIRTSAFTKEQDFFTLPTDALYVDSIWVNPSLGFRGYEMRRVSMHELGIEAEVVNPSSRYTFFNSEKIDYQYALTGDGETFRIHPVFGVNTTFDMYIAPRPNLLTSNSSLLDFKPEYHELVLAKLKQLVAEDIPESRIDSNTLRNRYLDRLSVLQPLAKKEVSTIKPFRMNMDRHRLSKLL